jgi:O-antigen ligase
MHFSGKNAIHLIKPSFDYWVLIFGLIIFKIPTFLGKTESIYARIICLIPFLISIFINFLKLLKRNKLNFNKQLFILFFFYLCIWGFAVLRSAFSGYFSFFSTFGNYFIWITFSLFGFLTFSVNNSPEKAVVYQKAIGYCLILYIVVNSITQIIGFVNQEEVYLSARPAVMLQYLGIFTDRVLFPLSSGINTEGLIAGASLCVSFLMLINSPVNKDRIFGTFGTLFSLYVIFLTDSRGALLFAGLTIFIAIVFKKRTVKLWRWLPLFTPVLPLMLLSIQKFFPESIVEALSRSSLISGSEILSGRQQIWNGILDHLKNFQLIHLFGYGYHGQLTSGISQSYSYLFTNFVSRELASAHNFILQTVIEIGYIGLIITFLLIISLTFSLAKLTINNPKDFIFNSLFFLLFYLVLTGTTETVLTPDHQELFFIFILIWAATGVTLSITSSKNFPNMDGKRVISNDQ